ncbi:MAG: hydantoinase/oxoprolinase family protein [Rhodospirillaceae bacterium]|nr:hydantoinase/oxoprolinase family protein [Rhodospirillaceae bacterium]
MDDNQTNCRIGVDVGGTFTDLVLISGGVSPHFLKISSTPEKPEIAVIEGVRAIVNQVGMSLSDVSEILHGTTVGSNTMLQRVGADTGLITTQGFRDVLEIGRLRTPEMFDLTWDKPAPLIPRRWRQEVAERIDASGQVLQQIDPEEVIAVGEHLVAQGVQSIAICFINAHKNGANELLAVDALKRAFPKLPVYPSVHILPEEQEYERTSTVSVNAYIGPLFGGYLSRLAEGLSDIGVAAPLLVSNSNGGLSAARMAQEKPVFFVSSGRSAGVVGASRLAGSVGIKDLIVFDMGGTTASASLIAEGEVLRTNEYEFRAGISTPSRFIKAGGYLMRVPSVDVAEVGSGAGSIAQVDAGGLLEVGPISAGALPGPACYGKGGTRPTVTDANVVLGYLPTSLAGGAVQLDVDAARECIEAQIAKPLGLGVEAAAQGIRDVVNANIVGAMRAVTVQRGMDPRDFSLMAFGGSGPVHACDLARTMSINKVIFPRAPGVFTAMGMLAGNVEHYFLRALGGYLTDLDRLPIREHAAALRNEGLSALAGEGYAPQAARLSFGIDLRFDGQESHITVPLDDPERPIDQARLLADFEQAYSKTYGYTPQDAVELVNIRLTAYGVNPNVLDFGDLRMPSIEKDTAKPVNAGSREETRMVYFGEGRGLVETPVLDRDHFTEPARGPFILNSPDTTIVIPPNVGVDLDDCGNLVCDLTSILQ